MKLIELNEYLPSNWSWEDMSAKQLKQSKPDPEHFADPQEYEEYINSWTAEVKGREDHYRPRAEAIIEMLSSRCQPYLQQNPNLIPMFRGTKWTGEDVMEKPIRSDRKPKDTDKVWTDIWDAGLAKRGFKANRTNSAFCTGDRHLAVQYGEPYVVFPVGEFNYSWHPYARDLYREISRYFGRVDKDVAILNYLQKSLNDVQGDDGTLTQAIHSDNEILIHGTSLLYVAWSCYEHIEDFILEALVYN